MRVNKILLLGVFLLLIIPMAAAVPPVTTIYTGEIGLQIEVNIMESYKLGDARYSIIHLFNTTNGYQLTNTTNPNIMCEIHLRDSQGFELSVVQAMPHLDHWDLNGTEGGTNPIGSYAYTIVCQDSDSETGGYTSGIFTITNSGNALTEGDSILNIGVLFFLVIVSILFLTTGISLTRRDINIIWGGFLLISIGVIILYGATSMASNFIINSNSLGGASVVSGLFLFAARMLKYSPMIVLGIVIYFVLKWRKSISDASPDGWDDNLYS